MRYHGVCLLDSGRQAANGIALVQLIWAQQMRMHVFVEKSYP